MAGSQIIRHSGIIKEIKEQSVIVEVISLSACSECHANGACSAADKKEKRFEIKNTSALFQPEEKVDVIISQSAGLKAVFYSYVIPFIIIMVSMIICSEFFNELLTALISLSFLIPYFIFLRLKKNKFEEKISFTLQKISN